MRKYCLSIITIFAVHFVPLGVRRQVPASEDKLVLKNLIVKKHISGRICDTCVVDFAHVSGNDGNFVMLGAGHTPARLSMFRDRIATPASGNSHIFIVSGGKVSLAFLPDPLKRKDQLYRTYGGTDFRQLAFTAIRNSKVIQPMKAISSLSESTEFIILGLDERSGAYVPWKSALSVGDFQLAVKDTISIIVRNVLTKKIQQSINVFRAVDKPTNFVYYQIPLTNGRFSINLQNILNITPEPSAVFLGDTLNLFEKEYASIGILWFKGVDKNEHIQYAFAGQPSHWKDISSINSQNGIALVLGNDMEAGKDHDLYLRYKSQPETKHKITIRIKEKPFEMPWLTVAVSTILLFVASATAFYFLQSRNAKRIRLLKTKKENAENQLALLSGQLNPHFLFNSLNAIQGAIKSLDPDQTYAYIGNVAQFMRDVMDMGKKEFVSLEEELALESSYLNLEQERRAFVYHIQSAMDIQLSQIDIPPLLLQPALENSIRHAFIPGHQNPVLNIQISKMANNLIIEVSDNGRKAWDTESARFGHGLSLINKRIAVYNERLEEMAINMEVTYISGVGTITTFTFQDWLA